MTKFVYSFGGGKAEGTPHDGNLLGGKGANLAEMSDIGIPVPPGFTITTEVCAALLRERRSIPEGSGPQVDAGLAAAGGAMPGKKFGDPAQPAAGLRPLRRAACRCPA